MPTTHLKSFGYSRNSLPMGNFREIEYCSYHDCSMKNKVIYELQWHKLINSKPVVSFGCVLCAVVARKMQTRPFRRQCRCTTRWWRRGRTGETIWKPSSPENGLPSFSAYLPPHSYFETVFTVVRLLMLILGQYKQRPSVRLQPVTTQQCVCRTRPSCMCACSEQSLSSLF